MRTPNNTKLRDQKKNIEHLLIVVFGGVKTAECVYAALQITSNYGTEMNENEFFVIDFFTYLPSFVSSSAQHTLLRITRDDVWRNFHQTASSVFH